jgi:hypothetical protein
MDFFKKFEKEFYVYLGAATRAALRLTRGNVCLVCIAPLEFSKYFDENGQPIVSEIDMLAYLNAITTSVEGINALE